MSDLTPVFTIQNPSPDQEGLVVCKICGEVFTLCDGKNYGPLTSAAFIEMWNHGQEHVTTNVGTTVDTAVAAVAASIAPAVAVAVAQAVPAAVAIAVAAADQPAPQPSPTPAPVTSLPASGF